MTGRPPVIPIVGVVIAVLLIGGFVAVGLGGFRARSGAAQSGTPSPNAPSASSPIASPDAATPFAGTPVASLPPVDGIPLPASGEAASWPVYQNSTLGLTLHYPPDWQVVEESEQLGVKLYPPDADPAVPSPLIAFSFAADVPYDPQAAPPPDTTQPHLVTVGGIVGRWYEDATYAVPTQGYYIDLPYRGGTLYVTASKGPGLNLVPVLQAILPTVALEP